MTTEELSDLFKLLKQIQRGLTGLATHVPSLSPNSVRSKLISLGNRVTEFDAQLRALCIADNRTEELLSSLRLGRRRKEPSPATTPSDGADV